MTDPSFPMSAPQQSPHPGPQQSPQQLQPPVFAPLPRYNVLALAAFAGAFIAPVVGIVFGHLSLRDLRWSHERGKGLATAGLIVGYVLTALFLLGGLLMLIVALAHLGGIPRGQLTYGPGSGSGSGGFGGGNGFGGGSGQGFDPGSGSGS